MRTPANFTTSVADLASYLRSTPFLPPFPALADRAAWHAVQTHLGTATVNAILAQAAADAARPIPPLTATLWLDFARTGHRENYEDPAGERRRRLWTLTLAECLEAKGRFLDGLLDLAWAICEESSWAYPAHESTLTDVTHPYLDLGVAGTAFTLAELDALVGNQLDPGLAKRIRAEIDRRCFIPYLMRDDHWWLFQSKGRNAANWTAVCNSGIVGAAIYLEPDPARLAAIIDRALHSLPDYLDSFDPDGGTSEGLGYWGYGFGHYVMLAHLIAQRTGGAVDLLAGERLRKIATFPLRTLLSHGTYVNFSDCDPAVALEPALLHYLGTRLNIPDLHGLARSQANNAPHRAYFDWGLRSLFWLPPADAPTQYAPARHDWFSGLQWLFTRVDTADPHALVLAAKGGHNDEMHNQNDVGNFIVHWQGESLIADVGRGKYTKEYLGEKRYNHFVNSSFGHSVPVVNGQVQGTGASFAAQLLEHQAGDQTHTLLLDLTNTYPAVAGLQSLQRRLTLHREPPHGRIILVDHFVFADERAAFESVLTTFHGVTLGESSVLIQGCHGKIRVGFDPAVVTVRLEAHEIDFDHGPTTVQRIVFAVQIAVRAGLVRLEIVPV